MSGKKFCQSCGMPMEKCPEGGGSEADGTRSETYCSYCYADGGFTWPDGTAAEMVAFCKNQMRKDGCGRLKAWLFTMGIPKLDRWKK